jgi:hypothetical protein
MQEAFDEDFSKLESEKDFFNKKKKNFFRYLKRDAQSVKISKSEIEFLKNNKKNAFL